MSAVPPLEIPTKISLWLRDPAKIAFRIISLAVLVAGGLTAAAAEWTDLIPEKYRGAVQVAVGVATTVAVIGNKALSWLIAHGYGPESNGKNGAWSPLAVYEAVEHAQTMSVRKQNHIGEDLPGAQEVVATPSNSDEVETFGVVL